MTPIINVSSVTRHFRQRKKRPGFFGSLSMLVNPEYETKVAVNEISFQIDKGEIIGYIGPQIDHDQDALRYPGSNFGID